MGADEEHAKTFAERVLALLEDRFSWLGPGRDEPIRGANTVDELSDLYKSLLDQREDESRER